MGVSIEDIKELRDKTGVSMQACKKALEECGGDQEKAIEELRKRGEAKAVDRAGRSAGEGVVAVFSKGNTTVMAKVNCETDFTARSADFAAFAEKVAQQFAEKGDANIDYTQALNDLSAKVGEKIEVGKPIFVSDQTVAFYVHTNKKLGAVVSCTGVGQGVARDIAMHVAASAPTTIKPEEVPADVVDKERHIWEAELKAQNKPEAIWANILKGKEKKFREEQSLLTQPFVKNPDVTVGRYLEESSPGAEIHEVWRVSI